MSKTKPTFTERIAHLRQIAEDLRQFCRDIAREGSPLLESADFLIAEAQRMETAMKRFDAAFQQRRRKATP